ncbi:Subtilisin BL-like protein [Cladobotryum mycophilum]|uniref:Subtilisin BL-like protein n=1 Tax=Cladobotryum mycophilum TaxID=491253 RepID=A0ABR0SI62_9HYPO
MSEAQRLVDAVEEYEGDVDTLITTWNECVDHVLAQISKPALLNLMNTYSEILMMHDYVDLAGAVDRTIESILSEDEESELDELDEQTRDFLIRNINKRWNAKLDVQDIEAQEQNYVAGDAYTKAFTETINHQPEIESVLPTRGINELPRVEVSQSDNSSSAPETRPRDTSSPHTPPIDAESRLLQSDNSSSSNTPAAEAEDSAHGTLSSSNWDTTKGDWFSMLKAQTHNLIYGHAYQFSGVKTPGGAGYKPIKIAVLDSGFCRQSMKLHMVSVQGRVNFVKGDGDTEDKADHGTTVAKILLETCPGAHLYIAKVTIDAEINNAADDDKATNNDNANRHMRVSKAAVATAIRCAANPEQWGVDIINMSFGWPFNDDKSIRDALSYAKANKVLLFASATNHGLTAVNSVQFPARASEVICVDAAQPLGRAADFSIADERDRGMERFSAPGHGYKSPISSEFKDGSSFASPVAAGIAALVLEFARQAPLYKNQGVQDSLRRREGMVRILREMTKQEPGAAAKFLCPWKILSDRFGDNGGEERLLFVRNHTASAIMFMLMEEFGRDIEHEVFSTTTSQAGRALEP